MLVSNICTFLVNRLMFILENNFVFIIIAITSIISITAFNRRDIYAKYLFNAYQIVRRKEWIRVVSHAFLHSSYEHLIINMLVLYFFADTALYYMADNFTLHPFILFTIFYLLAVVASSIFSLIKHKDNYYYNAIGASGAVSAVVFFCIFFDPWRLLYLYAVIPIPGILAGVAYLLYSYIKSKKDNDNIGHDAHFWGAIFGLSFPVLIKPELFYTFIKKLFLFM